MRKILGNVLQKNNLISLWEYSCLVTNKCIHIVTVLLIILVFGIIFILLVNHISSFQNSTLTKMEKALKTKTIYYNGEKASIIEMPCNDYVIFESCYYKLMLPTGLVVNEPIGSSKLK